MLVFTRTKHGADRVVQIAASRPAFRADAHPRQQGAERAQARARAFRDGRTRVLVATDIAARGIDVDVISHVINYELPNEPESYVHRIGRTARAGTGGSAVAFCDQSERPHLKAIEGLLRMSVAVASHRLAGPEPKSNGRRHEPRPSGQKPPARRAEQPAKAPAKSNWVSRGGGRGSALPAARGALTRPRAARLSLSGEAR